MSKEIVINFFIKYFLLLLGYYKSLEESSGGGCVGTTLWLRNLHSNEMLGEKIRWESLKSARCSLEETLEVAPHEAASLIS